MAFTALMVTLLFAALGLATALLVAVHDAVEAWLERRSLRTLQGRGGGGLSVPQSAPRKAGRRGRPAPLPVMANQTPATEHSSRPTWLENAQRDIAHRRQ